jgi:hypothetical protein
VYFFKCGCGEDPESLIGRNATLVPLSDGKLDDYEKRYLLRMTAAMKDPMKNGYVSI